MLKYRDLKQAGVFFFGKMILRAEFSVHRILKSETKFSLEMKKIRVYSKLREKREREREKSQVKFQSQRFFLEKIRIARGFSNNICRISDVIETRNSTANSDAKDR